VARLAGYAVPAPETNAPVSPGRIELRGNVRIQQPDGTRIEADEAQIVLTLPAPGATAEKVRAAADFRVVLDRGVPRLVPTIEPIPIGPANVPARDPAIHMTGASAPVDDDPARVAIPVPGGILELKVHVQK
jgi:hypothetical protein